MKVWIPNLSSLNEIGGSVKRLLGNADDDSDASWDRLSKKKQRDLKAKGWNKRAWNKDDPDLMDYYNEAERDWDKLPDDRKKYWIERGYDAKKWEQDVSELHDNPTTPSEGVPKVLTLSELAKLKSYDFSYFERNHGSMNIKVKNGKVDSSDEQPIAELKMADLIAMIRQGDTRYKVSAEDMDPEKGCLATVENETKNTILKALIDSELGGENKKAAFKPDWQKKDASFFNWSIWMGAKGTKTPMHFDTDLFNFLYVAEGKKRVVLIPKNKVTDKLFPLKEFYSGSGWTGVDILDRSFNLPEGSVDVEVCAGQGIFIPFRWYHAVENVESNVAFGFRVVE